MNDTTLQAAALRPDLAPSSRGLALSSDTGPSAVSWAAVFAGAVGAAALSLILLILGTGLGLSSVSPFTGQGAGAETFGISTIAWLTFTQLAASGIGGYLAGRLRTRWVSTHVDEVYFRDTAHGFLAWAVATLVTAVVLASTIGSIVGAGAKTVGAVAGGAATAATAAAAPMAAGAARSDSGGSGYFVDSLFRPSAPASGAGAGASAPTSGIVSAPTSPAASSSSADSASSNAEAARIIASGLQTGSLPANDVTYLGQVVSQRTGLSQADAEKRVNDTFASIKAKADQAKADAKEAADKARKASAYAALWLFITLLLGAFVASLSATFGGRQRDLV